MNNIKVKTKFRILFVITIAILISLGAATLIIVNNLKSQSLDMIKTSISTEYDTNIKQQVESVVSLCETYNKRIEAGELTKDEGMKQCAAEIRALRYSDTGYFWVDNYEGTNVVLLGGDKEGTNRLDTADANGFKMVADFIKGAKKNVKSGYFSNYYFPKENETKPSPKRAYTKAYEPFQWVIGTGNYTDYIQKDINEKNTLMTKTVRQVTYIILIVIVIIIAIEELYLVAVQRSIVRPLQATMKWLNHMKEGDFSIGIDKEAAARRDDFGTMMRSVEGMRVSVEKMLGLAQHTAIEVDDSAAHLSTSAQETKKNSDGITNAVEEIAEGATSQAGSVQKGVEAIGTIVDNVDDLTISVNSADEGAKKMAVSSENMKSNFNKLSEAMDNTHKSLDDVSDNIQLMGNSVSDVVAAVSAINEISEQTSLLSLNASIEAARAGEAGKGFAVVATEIQKLSVESAESAKKIGEIMQGLSQNSDTTIATVEELKASILEQLDISNETKGAALDMIVIADDVSEMFEKAKEACEATKLLCGDLSDTMSSLSAISEENAASSEETSATMTQVNTTVASIEGYSNDLNGIARQLNELLAVFKVSESYTEKENNE